MAKFSSPPAGPLAAGLESDFCRCRLEVLHVFQNFTRIRHGCRAHAARRKRQMGEEVGSLSLRGWHLARELLRDLAGWRNGGDSPMSNVCRWLLLLCGGGASRAVRTLAHTRGF